MEGTIDKVIGYTNEVVGKAKVAVGAAVGSEEITAKGAIQEAKGAAQVVWGKVKSAAEAKEPIEAEVAPLQVPGN